MKRVLITTAAGIALTIFQAAAYAEVDEKWAMAEAKEHGCLNCHAVDKKKAGPAWADVAANYKGKKPGDLSASIKGKPVHKKALTGSVDKELDMMSEWILSLKK